MFFEFLLAPVLVAMAINTIMIPLSIILSFFVILGGGIRVARCKELSATRFASVQQGAQCQVSLSQFTYTAGIEGSRPD